jgi:hypothetical protein
MTTINGKGSSTATFTTSGVLQVEDWLGSLTLDNLAQLDISCPITNLPSDVQAVTPFLPVFEVLRKCPTRIAKLDAIKFEVSLLERDGNAFSSVSATHLNEYLIKARAVGVPICRKKTPQFDFVWLETSEEWVSVVVNLRQKINR